MHQGNNMLHMEKYVGPYVTFLRKLHVWPGKHHQPDKLMFFKAILYNSYLFFTLLGIVLHFLQYREKKLSVVEDLIVMNIGAMIICLCSFYMYKLKAFLASYEEFCRFCDKFNRRNQVVPTSNKLTKICNLLVFLLSSLYYINKYFNQSHCEKINEAKNINISCGFFINVWFPFDFEQFPVKQGIILVQILTSFVSFTLLSNLCIVFGVGLFHVRTELRFLRNLLEEMPEHASREQFRIGLHCFSQAHTIIRKFVVDFNYISESMVGSYFIFASIILALVSFQAVMFPSGPTFVHLFCWIVVSWCVPAFSQYLLNECEELERAVYNLQWYEMNLSTQKTIYLILMQTQRPICIRAGAFSYLSVALCLRVWVKATRSYVAMMANALGWI